MPGLVKDLSLYSDFGTHRRQTTWGIGKIPPSMAKFFATLPSKDLAILIPGVGNTYEVVHLLKHGFTNITMVDFARGVMNRLRAQFDYYLDKEIRLLTVDFFEHTGSYDLIIEQSFLTTIERTLRHRYVDKMHSLLKNEGLLAGSFYERRIEQLYVQANTRPELDELFKDKFETLKMEISEGTYDSAMGAELFAILRKK